MTTAIIREGGVKQAISGYVAAKACNNLDLQVEAVLKLAKTAYNYLVNGGSINELDELTLGKKSEKEKSDGGER